MTDLPIQIVDDLSERFRRTPFSYPEVGATRQDRLPAGYRQLECSVDAGRGVKRFQELTDELMNWRLHARSGLSLQVSDHRVAQSSVEIATLSLGPFKITTRCRVVYLIDEQRRVGFAYGTLLGHPERGEERFTVQLTDDDRVIFGLRAFSRNAWLLARLGAPVSNRVQTMVNRRYLAAAAS